MFIENDPFTEIISLSLIFLTILAHIVSDVLDQNPFFSFGNELKSFAISIKPPSAVFLCLCLRFTPKKDLRRNKGALLLLEIVRSSQWSTLFLL